MIKDIFYLVGTLLKFFGKILKYSLKGIGWYLKNLSDIFQFQKQKTNKKCHIKGEIL